MTSLSRPDLDSAVARLSTRRGVKPEIQHLPQHLQPGEAVQSLAAGGAYLWEVQALSDNGLLRKEGSGFEVLKTEDAAGVRSNLDRIHESAGRDTPASHFLAGSYLFGHRIYDDAARHFRALARLSPEAPAPHEALGKVYRDQGLMDMAAAEFQQALALTRQP